MDSPVAATSSPVFTPRSSFRPSSLDKDLGCWDVVATDSKQYSMKMVMDDGDSSSESDSNIASRDEGIDAGCGEDNSDVLVNGRYNRWTVRPPLQRQIARSFPPEYYSSLAQVLPMQYVHIEVELCRAAAAHNFKDVIDRIYDDYHHRHLYLHTPGDFVNRLKNTMLYLKNEGRVSDEAVAEAIEYAQTVRHACS